MSGKILSSSSAQTPSDQMMETKFDDDDNNNNNNNNNSNDDSNQPKKLVKTSSSQKEKDPENETPIEKILKITGGFGLYQKLLVLLLFSSILAQTYFVVSMVYVYFMPHVQQICVEYPSVASEAGLFGQSQSSYKVHQFSKKDGFCDNNVPLDDFTSFHIFQGKKENKKASSSSNSKNSFNQEIREQIQETTVSDILVNDKINNSNSSKTAGSSVNTTKVQNKSTQSSKTNLVDDIKNLKTELKKDFDDLVNKVSPNINRIPKNLPNYDNLDFSFQKFNNQKNQSVTKLIDLKHFKKSYWNSENIHIIEDPQTFFNLFNIQQCSSRNESCYNNSCNHKHNSIYKGCLDPIVLKACRESENGHVLNVYGLRNGLPGAMRNAIMEFDWICDSQWKRDYGYTIGFLGIMAGTFSMGTIADHIGRRRTFMIGILATYLGGILLSTIASYGVGYVFVLNFIIGFGSNLSFYNGIVLVAECVNKKNRARAQIASVAGVAIGNITAPWTVYLIPIWREYYLIFWVFFLLVIPTSTHLLMIETPMYLLTNNKRQELIEGLSKIYRINKKREIGKKEIECLENIIDDDLNVRSRNSKLCSRHSRSSAVEDKENQAFISQNSEAQKQPKTNNKLQIIISKSKQILTNLKIYLPYINNVLLLSIYWLLLNFCNYCLNLNIANIPGNVFINATKVASFQLLAYPSALFLLGKMSRRKNLALWPFLTSIFIIFLMILPDNESEEPIRNLLYILAAYTLTGSYRVLFLVGTEMFPTKVRGTCFGIAGGIGRVGLILAPAWVFASSEDGNVLRFYAVVFVAMLINFVVVFFMPKVHKDIV